MKDVDKADYVINIDTWFFWYETI